MIRAMIFDLDGTLVQTERLKALSYARAAVELCPSEINETEVIEAFKEVVGLSRREVASILMERFDLTGKARKRMAEFGVNTPWPFVCNHTRGFTNGLGLRYQILLQKSMQLI